MSVKLYTAAVALLALAACTNDENYDPFADGPVAAQVTAGISRTMTRVSTDDSGAASFSKDDVIHVVANGSTYDYSYDGPDWSAVSTPYYFQDRNDVTFRAWYADPSVEVNDENLISIDTHTQTYSESGWNRHDILATPEVKTTVSNPSVSFTGDNAFRHIMSQLVFTFKKGDGIPDLSELSGYTLDNIIIGATFDTQNLELTAEKSGKESFIDITGIDDASGEEYTASPLILVPQTITSGKLNLLVSYNEQTYEAELNAPDGNQLQPGYSYAYNVVISNTELTVDDATIKDWETLKGFNGTGEATLQ